MPRAPGRPVWRRHQRGLAPTPRPASQLANDTEHAHRPVETRRPMSYDARTRCAAGRHHRACATPPTLMAGGAEPGPARDGLSRRAETFVFEHSRPCSADDAARGFWFLEAHGMASRRVEALAPAIQNYAWGSRSALRAAARASAQRQARSRGLVRSAPARALAARRGFGRHAGRAHRRGPAARAGRRDEFAPALRRSPAVSGEAAGGRRSRCPFKFTPTPSRRARVSSVKSAKVLPERIPAATTAMLRTSPSSCWR